ncbi:MAG: winged helix DNA-binding protein [Bacteroidota bacterium]
MSHKYHLLREIVDLLEQYETETQDTSPNLFPFAVWLNNRLAYPNPVAITRPTEGGLDEEQSQTVLTMLLSYLNRYAKHYSKKALEDTPLSTMDDFTFLATLSYEDSLTKTELIQMHLLEITSGIEIIKRLEKHGLLESFADHRDKRSKRVKITPQGEKVLTKVMEKMDQVASILSGNLAAQELGQLLPLLHKLNDFHAVIHHNDKKTALDQIEAKYLKETANSLS